MIATSRLRPLLAVVLVVGCGSNTIPTLDEQAMGSGARAVP